jgi:hypothetical protein
VEDEDMNAENSQRGARATEKSGVIQKATRRPKWNVNKNWREKGRKLAAGINTVLHIYEDRNNMSHDLEDMSGIMSVSKV